jgi:tRNA uridine 5-carboxymethylaminomethyl modification enzyme
VLVDDLITQGVAEPYRMFTSRAEYRLNLREDNADLRLTETGHRLGVVTQHRWDAFRRKRDNIDAEKVRIKRTWLGPRIMNEQQMSEVFGGVLEREYSLEDLLRRPTVSYQRLMALPGAGPGLDDAVAAEQVEIQTKYQGYIERQREEIERQAVYENARFPKQFDFAAVRGLSAEVTQKLQNQRPETLGQAMRIQGITPAAISLLLVHLKRGRTPGDGKASQAANEGTSSVSRARRIQ